MSNDLTNSNMTQAYPMAELKDVANAFVECGFYGFKKPAEALVLMLQARADGIDPMTAAAQYSIIQGRPALKAEAILIRFQAAGGSIKWKKREDEICTLWLSHPKGGELEITWNKDRATKAGLWNKDNFKKHPAQMLAARCISEGVRALYPACLSGCYTPEEVMLFEDNNSKPTQAPRAAKAATKDPVQEAIDATYGNEPEKPSKADAKKAEAVEAEVVEPPAKMDEKTEAFVNAMYDLRNANRVAFDDVWAKNYVNKYGVDFAKIPEADRRPIYSGVKKLLSANAANNIGDFLEEA